MTDYHLLLKFHDAWEAAGVDVVPMDEHQALIKKHGSCWWGGYWTTRTL